MVDYNSLPADPQDLEEKLRKFREAAQVFVNELSAVMMMM